MVNLYATFDIQIDSINTLSNKILDNMLSLIIIATNNVIVENTYDRILFVFLSLFVYIGKFTVSAGAYKLTIIIENTKIIKITVYFAYIDVQIIYLLIKTFP